MSERPEHPSRPYIRQLLRMRNGYPLYFPDRPRTLPPALIARGTSIGDVGLVQPDGSFHYAFNVFTPQADGAINCFGVPVGFYPLPLRARDIVVYTNKYPKRSVFKTGAAVNADRSVDADASGGSTTAAAAAAAAAFKLGYRVVDPSAESALLALPDGAMSEDYSRLGAIHAYAEQNGLAWYEFVRGPLGLAAPNGALHVVTGCDKSAAWGIATIAENSASKGSTLGFTAQSAASAAAGAGCACSWATTDGSIPTRTSPNPEPGVEQPRNQCIFIRGSQILLRSSVFRRGQFVTLECMTDNPYIDSLLRQNKKSFPGRETGGKSWWRRLFGCSQPAGTSHREGAEPADDFVDKVELDPLTGPYHAPDTIDKYLLEKNPQAQVAISHERTSTVST
ncbi:hypothetical protein FIBSPDRAFT_858940 [Athelia psychrophila]|uniref:Uncharacterized protein n=1 Tax=Athelia psychrophila TaxID=1759441 RepID=A0A166LIU9_9AGAM|nr:hypothetical protein FIBSPDRAFT_858940 [Fibularhizoctonia sp. CBS 109695]